MRAPPFSSLRSPRASRLPQGPFPTLFPPPQRPASFLSSSSSSSHSASQRRCHLLREAFPDHSSPRIPGPCWTRVTAPAAFPTQRVFECKTVALGNFVNVWRETHHKKESSPVPPFESGLLCCCCCVVEAVCIFWMWAPLSGIQLANIFSHSLGSQCFHPMAGRLIPAESMEPGLFGKHQASTVPAA